MNERKEIISLIISTHSYQAALHELTNLAKRRSPSYVCFANAHMIIEAYRNKNFRALVNASTLTLPDGMPIVFSLKLLHGVAQERVAGMDFMTDVIRVCEAERLSVFFLGSTDQVLNAIKEKSERDFPNLKIAGMFSPPFRKTTIEETNAYIDMINRSGAHFVLVSLGCPKQENWMAQNSKNINAILLGVGGAFPVYAGLVKRAPNWMQRFSLEWLYRLLQEPRRMWKRYFVTNTMFICLLVLQFFKRRIFFLNMS